MRLTRYRPTSRAPVELSTTSMIDVVFLLLIFFIATTTFLAPERQLDPAIVVEQSEPGTSDISLEPLYIELVVQDGSPVYRLGATASHRIEAIRPIVQQYPDKSVGAWIRMSDEVPFSMAASAVNVCKDAGFVDVSLVPLRTGSPNRGASE